MNERLFWAAALFAVAGLALLLLRRQSPLSIPVLAVGITAVVGVFYPLASLVVEPRSWRNLSDLSEEALLGTQVDYLAFAVGLTLAVFLAGALRPRGLAAQSSAPEASRRIAFRDAFTTWALLLVGAALYSEYVRRVGYATLSSTHDFAEKYYASRGLGTLLLGLNLMIAACLWAEAGAVGRGTRLALRAVGGAILFWAIAIIAVRTYAAALVLGYVFVFCERRCIQLRRVRVGVLVLMFAAYLGLEGYAILRSTWTRTGDLGAAISMAAKVGKDDALGSVIGGSELSHPFLTAAEIQQFEEPGALRGASYVEAVQVFVPLFLWPDRPTTLAQRYVAEYYPALDARGGGSAFSFVAEAWWNFGHVFGPLLAGALLGALLMLLHERARRRPHGIVQRLVPYLVFIVLLFHRSQLSASFKLAMGVVLPAVALALLAEALWLGLVAPKQRQRSSRTAHVDPRLATEAR